MFHSKTEITLYSNEYEHMKDESCYNNNWYKHKSGNHYIFIKCWEEYNQDDVYIANEPNEDKMTFLFSSDCFFDDNVLARGKLGDMWT